MPLLFCSQRKEKTHTSNHEKGSQLAKFQMAVSPSSIDFPVIQTDLCFPRLDTTACFAGATSGHDSSLKASKDRSAKAKI